MDDLLWRVGEARGVFLLVMQIFQAAADLHLQKNVLVPAQVLLRSPQ